MSEQNYTNVQQQAELMKYISDNMKIPVLGAGGGFAPIGTRAYFDGTLAPQGWLICDGSTHNIADYPELSAYFASHHGSSNYYGGDGTTTFATPVMNGMPNGGVDTPDEHIVGEWRETVDGVLKKKPVYNKTIEYDNIKMSGSGSYTVIDNALLTTKLQNLDKIIKSDTTVIVRSGNNSETSNEYYIDREAGTYSVKQFWTSQGELYYDIRLIIFYTKSTDSWSVIQEGHSADGNGVFCIKATVSGDANAHQYSTDEQIVGTYNGKYLYEKSWFNVSVSNNTTVDLTSMESNLEHIKSIDGMFYQSSSNNEFPIGCNANCWCYYEKSFHGIAFQSSANWTGTMDITIQYTKTQ